MTDTRNNTFTAPAFAAVELFGMRFTAALTPGANTQVATTAVLGSVGNNAFALKSPASPDLGIGPGAVIASDNTLGAFSPNQGRLYVAYTDVLRGLGPMAKDSLGQSVNNDPNNTDIFLAYSDNGGQTWTVPTGAFGLKVPVNDDNATTDGFSQSGLTDTNPESVTLFANGRSQFLPSIAVDQTTGTLALSFYDARNDASNARVANYIATSLDGGLSFGPETYVNPQKVATDAVDDTTQVIFGPIPENDSAGNAIRDTTFGLGLHEALVVTGGHVVPLWGGDQDGGVDGKKLFNIYTARVTIAAGPRIVDGTMGPVQATTVTTTAGARTFNAPAADGTPQASGFVITFDRPVDPASFTPGDVTISYRDTNPNDSAQSITASNVYPIVGSGPDSNGRYGYTQFLVAFPAHSGLGTYSYTVGPAIDDRIRRPNQPSAVNQMDQNSNAVTDQNPGDVFSVPTSSTDTATLPLIVYGARVASTSVPGVLTADGSQTQVDNATASALDVTFDRPILASTFTPSAVLRMMGPTGLIGGPFTVTPLALSAGLATTFRIGFPTQQLSGTYTIQIASTVQDANGNPLDENQNAGVDVLRGFSPNGTQVQTTYNSTGPAAINPAPASPATSTVNVPDNYPVQGVVVQLNITHPNDPDLTATLTAPNGKSAVLFSNVGATGTHANFTNTVFDDAAATPISNGGPPYFGHFEPMSPFTTAFVFNPNNPTDPLLPVGSMGTWSLTITDSGTSTGTLTNWSLTLLKKIPNSGLGEPVADQASASFRIFTMDPTNPLSSNTWTAVGPVGIGGGGEGAEGGGSGGRSGRIGGIAVDPSDPSGNTVYIGGASGGVWKTTDFLTTDPAGPTYIPLTDFGASFAINIGSIAVFGRNNDPNQSIIFAGTGEGDTKTAGVGFLRSMDGGATWALLDSTTNVDAGGNPLPFNSPLRDHIFTKGTSTFKVVVDPILSPTGDVIVYAALSGANGGLWRSIDTGKTWAKVSVDATQGTNATDVVLDPASGTGAGGSGGNLQILYAAFQGSGVYMSTNRGQMLSLVSGGQGNSLILDLGKNVNPAAPQPTPNGAFGRIELAKPALTGNAAEDKIYQGWLYAGVIDTSSHFRGLYLTKDFGQNWTQVRIPTMPPVAATQGQYPQAIPTNDLNQADYDLGGGPPGTGLPVQGNYDFSLDIDPTNPNVVYMGGTEDGQPTGYLRIDTTGIFDAHALVGYSANGNDGGQLLTNSTGGVTTTDHTKNPQFEIMNNQVSYINFIRNPNDPFNASATLNLYNAGQFSNTGANVTWIPFDMGGTDQHRVVTVKDPLTGHARIIIGDDQGVFSEVDNNGTFDAGIGTAQQPDGDRNGNLQITQFYYGAAQPTNVAADLASALFYGSTQDNGGPGSDPNIIGDPTQPGYGNLNWDGPGGDATGVATNQQAGTVDPSTGQVVSPTLYQYWWPAAGGGYTNFFQVDGVGRTFGLIQGSAGLPTPDPEWGPTGGSNFTVNPLSGQQIIISSNAGANAGRLFETENQGQTWFIISPSLDGSYAPALAYGAPDPSVPGYQGNLDSFIYAGTGNGNIYVTQTGGGQWFKISNGLDGTPVQQIVTDPTRGSHRAYAITANHVYYTPDSIQLANTPALKWIDITGNASLLKDYASGQFGSALAVNDPTLAVNNLAKGFTTIQADWRYVIPDDPTKPNGPTHPVLYAGGEAGVFRSTDNGQTWTIFPSIAVDGTSQDGGYLPNAKVTQLSMVLGNIDPTTGRALQSTTVPDPPQHGQDRPGDRPRHPDGLHLWPGRVRDPALPGRPDQHGAAAQPPHARPIERRGGRQRGPGDQEPDAHRRWTERAVGVRQLGDGQRLRRCDRPPEPDRDGHDRRQRQLQDHDHHAVQDGRLGGRPAYAQRPGDRPVGLQGERRHPEIRPRHPAAGRPDPDPPRRLDRHGLLLRRRLHGRQQLGRPRGAGDRRGRHRAGRDRPALSHHDPQRRARGRVAGAGQHRGRRRVGGDGPRPGPGPRPEPPGRDPVGRPAGGRHARGDPRHPRRQPARHRRPPGAVVLRLHRPPDRRRGQHGPDGDGDGQGRDRLGRPRHADARPPARQRHRAIQRRRRDGRQQLGRPPRAPVQRGRGAAQRDRPSSSGTASTRGSRTPPRGPPPRRWRWPTACWGRSRMGRTRTRSGRWTSRAIRDRRVARPRP